MKKELYNKDTGQCQKKATLEGSCIASDFHFHSTSARHIRDQAHGPGHGPEPLQFFQFKLQHQLSDHRQLFQPLTDPALVLGALCSPRPFPWNTSSRYFLADILNLYPSVAFTWQ